METIKLWIGTADDPDDRPTIVISTADYQRLPVRFAEDWDRTIRVKNIDTGKMVRIRRAVCGLDCRCALEFVK